MGDIRAGFNPYIFIFFRTESDLFSFFGSHIFNDHLYFALYDAKPFMPLFVIMVTPYNAFLFKGDKINLAEFIFFGIQFGFFQKNNEFSPLIRECFKFGDFKI